LFDIDLRGSPLGMDVVLHVRQSGTAMQTYTAEALVELLELSPHPEGGYFRETFRASQRVRRSADSLSLHDRAAGTAIYYLLPGGAFSAWHRVHADEVWHHYDGAPAELHLIELTGVHTVVALGRDLARGERPQHVVPAGWFQATRPVALCGSTASYTLCGCTVSPGFELADFEMPSRAELHRRFPHLGDIIDALARP
jgi:predicted cupin superfamily sugar epimerase